MKKSLTIFLILASLVIFISVVPVQALPIVNLNVLDNNITVGENFDVEVMADGNGIGEDLLGFGFDVLVPGNFFSYEGYTIESDFFDVSDPYIPINVSGGFNPVSDDDVLLATLSFKALAVGSDYLGVMGPNDGFYYGLIYEINGSDINAIANITINPESSTPVPEPSTVLLISIGFVGLAFFKRFSERNF